MGKYRFQRKQYAGTVKYTPNHNSAKPGYGFITIISEGYYTDAYGHPVHTEYYGEVKNTMKLKHGDKVWFQPGIGVGIINEGWKRARAITKR